MIDDMLRLFVLCQSSPWSSAAALSLRQGSNAQGLGAINAVGKAAVQVANSLDTAVETLFEGWNASPPKAATSADSQVTQQVVLLASAVPQGRSKVVFTVLAQ